MPDAHFLQIHTLHGYSAVLLNRDDSGLAKRMTYGDAIRTRISSQCLKRHWRMADGIHSLRGIDGATAAVRSRQTVTRRVIGPLQENGHDPVAITAIENAFQRAVYGSDKGETSRQPLLLGEPEISYLAAQAKQLAGAHGGDAAAAEQAAKQWEKNAKGNMKELRNKSKLPGGIEAALFGRMVTSDVEANIDAPVHVATRVHPSTRSKAKATISPLSMICSEARMSRGPTISAKPNSHPGCSTVMSCSTAPCCSTISVRIAIWLVRWLNAWCI